MTKKHIDKTFKHAYLKHRDKLVQLAERRLLDKTSAPDIVQDSFLKLYEYMIKNGVDGFSPFILRRNIIIACAKLNKESKAKVTLSYKHGEED